MINIYGGGISGLTVAHILVKKGFNVSVYEKNDIAGGMARSVRLENNVPTEHSWRGYGPFYNNLFKLLKQIPLNNIETFSSYTIEEISKHNTKYDFWCYYKNNVYDLTNFVNNHPGGINNIMKAAGGNLEKVWSDEGVLWHIKNSSVINILKKYKIGNLKELFVTNKTVYDNLSKKKLYFDVLFNKLDNEKANINFYDYFYLFYLFGKVMTSNKRRNEYFRTRLEPFLKKNLSKNSYHFLVDFIAGPGYGFDKNSMSLAHYAIFIEFNFFNKEKLWQVMNKPTSEAWINPWVKYLKKLGVKFYFNYNINKLISDGKNIKYSIAYFKNKKIKLKANEHIVCFDSFNTKTLLYKSNFKKLSKKYEKLNTINNQISFRLGINRKIKFEKDNMGFVLADSPYNITFYPQEDHWEKNIDLGMNGKIKSLWSGTIIIPYNNGSLTNKSATSLDISVLKEEIIYQFMESKQLKYIIKKYNNGYNLSKKDIIFSEIFEDWYFENSRLKTKNKKWVNNSNNEHYRPGNKTKFKNLYIAGAYTKTSVNIWSMESAVESGILASNILLKKYKKKIYPIYTHKSLKIFEPFKSIDDILYTINFPHLFDILILVLIIYILYKLKYKIIY